ncbi:hypothetical protein [Streptomyces sp. NPDC096311]|uniref:hypothetical protein n=1 Tax=Streptomyces sp. NPDC096311 TaxID=3366083 RepID=UPI00380E069C
MPRFTDKTVVITGAVQRNSAGSTSGSMACTPASSKAYDPATGELIVGIDDQPIPRLADVDEISSLVLFVGSDDAGRPTGAECVAGGYLPGSVPAAKL